ncbi:hypothetical protein TNCV_1568431 [Trichonephila clavipes]|nr:hypothetical protein TNCV_1568431 [Trichonephila clavipes]
MGELDSGLAKMEASFHSRLSRSKTMIRIISTFKCYIRLYYPKNWEFWTVCQLAESDDHGPCISLGLPPHYSFSQKAVVGRDGLCDLAQQPEGQGLLCPSQYMRQLDAKVHDQMSRSGGQSEARQPVFKSQSKLGAHLSTHCSRDERLSRPCPARE